MISSWNFTNCINVCYPLEYGLPALSTPSLCDPHIHKLKLKNISWCNRFEAMAMHLAITLPSGMWFGGDLNLYLNIVLQSFTHTLRYTSYNRCWSPFETYSLSVTGLEVGYGVIWEDVNIYLNLVLQSCTHTLRYTSYNRRRSPFETNSLWVTGLEVGYGSDSIFKNNFTNFVSPTTVAAVIRLLHVDSPLKFSTVFLNGKYLYFLCFSYFKSVCRISSAMSGLHFHWMICSQNISSKPIMAKICTCVQQKIFKKRKKKDLHIDREKLTDDLFSKLSLWCHINQVYIFLGWFVLKLLGFIITR